MTRKRVCLVPGCPELSTEKRCTKHRREHESRRGTTTDRGYGARHDKERRKIINRGIENFRCARCGIQFENGEPFQLGHTDDRESWSGPEHIRCNLGAAGQAAHAIFERRG